jgi:hypothetical protein
MTDMRHLFEHGAEIGRAVVCCWGLAKRGRHYDGFKTGPCAPQVHGTNKSGDVRTIPQRFEAGRSFDRHMLKIVVAWI